MRPGKDSQPQEQPGLALVKAERVDESVTETSPEQRGSEVHTKKTVMIKTIETRDGEVSGLPGTLTPEVRGACGVCLGGGGCQPDVFYQPCWFCLGAEGSAMLGRRCPGVMTPFSGQPWVRLGFSSSPGRQ